MRSLDILVECLREPLMRRNDKGEPTVGVFDSSSINLSGQAFHGAVIGTFGLVSSTLVLEGCFLEVGGRHHLFTWNGLP